MSKIQIYETKCSLCGLRIRDITEDLLKEKLIHHINNECPVATTVLDWQKEGIYKEAIQILRSETLERDLLKLRKKYSMDEIRRELDLLEEFQE